MDFFKIWMNMNILGCLFMGILVLCYYSLITLLFMLLWNWLVPLFWTSAPILTFFQSFGVIILISFISFLFIKK